MTISEIAAQFSKMFDKSNKKVCSNCPKASPNSMVADCRDNSGFVSREAGCCSRCFSLPGYFYRGDFKTTKLKDDVVAKLKQNYGYDEKYGFFNNDIKQCLIPREFRSE